VTAYDPNPLSIANFKSGKLLVSEPGLQEMMSAQLKMERLLFSSTESDLTNIDLFVLAFDTPVNEKDEANVDLVLDEFKRIAIYLNKKTTIMISSQLPVGSSDILQNFMSGYGHEGSIVVQPENLRLGRALETFFHPGRIIVGTQDGVIEPVIVEAFKGIGAPIIWMNRKSAEVTKHALNSYLATSITFMGEISEICELVGADAKEVEQGLKSDSRIGQNAYLSPGLGFAGGTLARDVITLSNLQKQIRKEPGILSSLMNSNAYNNNWLERNLEIIISENKGLKICFWGVSYVENTDTLRRSEIYDLMKKLVNKNFFVSYVENHPISDLVHPKIKCYESIEESLTKIDVLVVSKKILKNNTHDLTVESLDKTELWILDPSRILLEAQPSLINSPRYLTVGKSVT
jgi:UDPglucose 6-dehydrogenase